VVEGMDSAALATGGRFMGPSGQFFVPRRGGNPDLGPETPRPHERGYRIQPTPRVSEDAAEVYNDNSDPTSYAQTARFEQCPPVGTAEFPYENMLSGHSYGGELAVTVSPSVWWRLTASYSLLIADINGPAAAGPEAIERSAPRHQ